MQKENLKTTVSSHNDRARLLTFDGNKFTDRKRFRMRQKNRDIHLQFSEGVLFNPKGALDSGQASLRSRHRARLRSDATRTLTQQLFPRVDAVVGVVVSDGGRLAVADRARRRR